MTDYSVCEMNNRCKKGQIVNEEEVKGCGGDGCMRIDVMCGGQLLGQYFHCAILLGFGLVVWI